MTRRLTRRDFLKLSGVLSTAAMLPTFRLLPSRKATADMPNILVLVYDALSAMHASLHGYPRETTPNLDRLAKKATVFHQHYAGGNFTYPGTTSLLTGTYPWTHRGFSQYKGIDPQFHNRNIFQLFDQYHRISYSHNSLVNNLFTDMQLNIDQFKPREELLLSQLKFSELLFRNDETISWMSWWLAIEKFETAYTPFLSRLIKSYKNQLTAEYRGLYPRGLPSEEGQTFLLETATDWTLSALSELDEPYLGYFHYLPPHDPYHTRSEFVDAFLDDGFELREKAEHTFTQGYSDAHMNYNRRQYDEYVLLADMEFGRLFDELERKGLLDNTIVILTSDHGEMFERGIEKHFHETLHQPVIHIPLMVFSPGQTERRDVYSPTSAVDLIPTLLHITGQPIPDWLEGQVLPAFGDAEHDPQRAVYAVEAKDSPLYGTINPVSLMIVKDGFKLTYYAGWAQQGENSPIVELYAIEDDPEEMNNLAEEMPDLREALLAEVLAKAGK